MTLGSNFSSIDPHSSSSCTTICECLDWAPPPPQPISTPSTEDYLCRSPQQPHQVQVGCSSIPMSQIFGWCWYFMFFVRVLGQISIFLLFIYIIRKLLEVRGAFLVSERRVK